MLELNGNFKNELGGSDFRIDGINIMTIMKSYNNLDKEDKINFSLFVLDIFKQELEYFEGTKEFH